MLADGSASNEILNERLENLREMLHHNRLQMDRIEQKFNSSQFVTREEYNRLANSVVMKEGRYWLVEKIVFGMVGLVLVTVLAALLLQSGVSGR